MWLDMLEIGLVICYRKTDFPYLSFSQIPRDRRRLVHRREHWLKAYRRNLGSFDSEDAAYKMWDATETRSAAHNDFDVTNYPATLFDVCATFFAISYKFQSYLGHDINQAWVDLAGELLLQSAVELFWGHGDSREMEHPLACVFAWGWTDPDSWDEYFEETKDANAETELDIGELFEDKAEKTSENQTWRKARRKYLSKFEMESPKSVVEVKEELLGRLREISKEFPIDKFEEKMIEFILDIWGRVQKPLLVQVEEGKIDGLDHHEFDLLRTRSFLSESPAEKSVEARELSPVDRSLREWLNLPKAESVDPSMRRKATSRSRIKDKASHPISGGDDGEDSVVSNI